MILSKSNRFGVVVSILFLTIVIFGLLTTQAFADNYTSTCIDLTVENETYVLSGDLGINATCFTFLAANITFDGNGSTIYVNDSLFDMIYVFNVTEKFNATITNLTFNGTLTNTTVIYINGSNNTRITNVNITNSTRSLWNEFSNGTIITNLQVNNSLSSGFGAYLKDSTNITLRDVSIFESPVSPINFLRITHSTATNLSLGVSSTVTLSIEATNLSIRNLTRNSGIIDASLVSTSQLTLDNFNLSSITLNSGNSYITLKNGFFSDSPQPVSFYDISNSLLDNISWYNISGPNLRFSTSSGVNNPSNLTFNSLNFTNGNETDILTSNEEGHNGTLTFNNTVLNLFNISGVGFRFQYKLNNLSVNFSTPINGTGNFSSHIQFVNQSSIYVNDSTTFNQSMNVTFFNLLTNYSSQKIYRNNSICLSPECSNLSTLNQAVVSWVVDRAGNFTIVDIGVLPASIITGLVAGEINNNNITWNWTNPGEFDFNGTLIFINDTNVANLSKSTSSYTAVNLTHNLRYLVRIQTIDYDLYVNTTTVELNTTTSLDAISPSWVGDLESALIDRDVLVFNWTLPTDEDYRYLNIYFNSILHYNQTNITNITFTGLIPNTTYNLTVISYDRNGNYNTTSNISTTLDDAYSSTVITTCGTISMSGDYILGASEIQSNYTCLFVTATNVTFDGNGSTIAFGKSNDSVNASGISITSATNVTLRNLTIIGNSLMNLSRRGIFVNRSSQITIETLNVNQSSIGVVLLNSSYVTLNSSNLTQTNISLVVNASYQSVSILNSLFTNTSTGILASTQAQAIFTNITINNATIVAINVSNNSHISLDQFNWTLPTNTTSTLLLDAKNTTQFTNSSMLYGNLEFTNFSAGNLSLYTIKMDTGNFSMSKQNASAVTFSLNTSTIDSFNFTRDISLDYNNVFANITATPFLDRSVMITFYDMEEQTPVNKTRNGVLFDTTTTPSGSNQTLLTARTVVINTSSLDGNYSIRGYTLKLLEPTNDSVIDDNSVNFRYYVTSTLNRNITGCNLTLNSTLISRRTSSDFLNESTFDYVYSSLIDDSNYTWQVYCLDNVGAEISETGNFSVNITETTSSSGRSGAFGSGAAMPWINTYLRDKYELNSSITIILKLWDGVRLKVNNNSHHVGVIAVTATTITVNVSSTPQQAVLKINETKNFIVDENESKGISVTLNSIGNYSVNITIAPTSIDLNTTSSDVVEVESNQSDSQASTSAVSTSTPGDFAAASKAAFVGFVATKGIIAIIIIGGVITFCGVLYYFYLFMKYKKGLAQPLNQLSAKKGLLAEFIFPFMPGGEYWINKQKESQAQLKTLHQTGPNPVYVKHYMDTINQLVPPEHASHIEGRLRLGNTYDYIEFELIENGYTREQAKSLVKKYQIDQYVKNCILAGATNEQVRNQLLNSGWQGSFVAMVFKPTESKDKFDLLK